MYPYCHYSCWSCNTSISICTHIPIIDELLRTRRNKIYSNFFFIWKSEQRCYSFVEGCYIGNENKVSPICMSEFYWYSLFGCSIVSDSLKPRRLPYARLPCLSPSPGVCSNSCPLILISLLIEIQLLKTNQLTEKLTQGSREKGNSFLLPFLPVLGWKKSASFSPDGRSLCRNKIWWQGVFSPRQLSLVLMLSLFYPSEKYPPLARVILLRKTTNVHFK